MTTIAPGYATTEFWGKLAVQVIAFLVLIGVINPAPGVGDAVGSIVGLVGPEIFYALSRGHVKAAAALSTAPTSTSSSAATPAPTPADLHASLTGAAQQLAALTGGAPPAPPAP